MASYFSLVTLYGNYLRRSFFISSNLTHQTIKIDPQTTISFWGPTPTSKSDKNPSLLMLHGFGPSAIWQWRYQVKTLSPHFNLYVPDLIFFGGSTTTSSERSEVFQAVCMGKLMERVGVERYYVMGTSYGGFVGYKMGNMFGERIEKVVLASSAINKRRSDNIELLKRAKLEKIEDLMLPKTAAQLRSLIELAVLNRPRYMPEFLLNDFIKSLYSENLEQKTELLKGLTFGNDDEVHITPLPQKDVLIVWGEQDHIFFLKKAMEIKELLGDKATLEVIKNTSHTPQAEDPQTFNDIVIKFLSKP